jgi:hypothetical protein
MSAPMHEKGEKRGKGLTPVPEDKMMFRQAT